ncbi:hypothetical protein QA640_18410 [Bradyrhizobium sp. CB82]|uniref:hypothetical protein n=1 Tax=Bradyrhizobium sp. CB82 TaxID=3039159 RepID=UPI0024B0707B|nr:hypothetical protein [Bradyrhizobium sp. CB82]WFU45399.1 hypothetical protein QA640_18410 [Bradyrhizobium sp. CB82]
MSERHGKGGRRLGAPARQQVQLRHLHALLNRADQLRAVVEVAHDLEDVFLDCFRRGSRSEQPANMQMGGGAFSLRDQRVGRLLESIVCEPIGVGLGLYEFVSNSGPQVCMDLLIRPPEDDRKHRDLGSISETGHLLQGGARCNRQPGELSEHEVDDVVSVSLGVDAIEIPRPACRIMVEREQPFFDQ